MSKDIVLDAVESIFKSSDLFLNSIRKLESEDKYLFTKEIIGSKLESHFLTKFREHNLNETIGSRNLRLIKASGAGRSIKTIENLRIAQILAKKFRDKKINYVFLKGLNAYHYQIYKINERPLIDIDITIKKESLRKVIDICREIGFKTNYWQSYSNSSAIYANPTFSHYESTALIDIHTDILGDKSFLDKVFAEAHKSEDGMLGNYCSLETYFIHTLYHGTVKSNFNQGPIFLLDLKKMLECKMINWEKVLRQLKDYKLEDALINVLGYMKDMAKIPGEFESLITKPPFLQKDDVRLLMLSPPNNSNMQVTANQSKQAVLMSIFKSLFSFKYISLYSSQSFSFSYYFEYVFRYFRVNIGKLFKKNNPKLSKIRSKYKKKLVSDISK